MNTTITKIAWLCLAAIPALAHGGFDHVMGTVVQVSNNTMTVKTAKATST